MVLFKMNKNLTFFYFKFAYLSGEEYCFAVLFFVELKYKMTDFIGHHITIDELELSCISEIHIIYNMIDRR